MHKRLVAGLSRLVTCLQSNFIGTNFHGLLFKLRCLQAFQLSLCFLLGAYWLAGSRLPDGGGNPIISGETETQVQATCQPRQPHSRYHKSFQSHWPTVSIGLLWSRDKITQPCYKPWENCSKDQGEETGYTEVLQQSLNIKRLLVIKENQTS